MSAQQPHRGIVVQISFRVLRIDGLDPSDVSDYCVQWARGKDASGLTDWSRSSGVSVYFTSENTGSIARSVIPLAGTRLPPKTLKFSLIRRSDLMSPSAPVAGLRYPLLYEHDLHRNTTARLSIVSPCIDPSFAPAQGLAIQFELHVTASVAAPQRLSSGCLHSGVSVSVAARPHAPPPLDVPTANAPCGLEGRAASQWHCGPEGSRVGATRDPSQLGTLKSFTVGCAPPVEPVLAKKSCAARSAASPTPSPAARSDATSIPRFGDRCDQALDFVNQCDTRCSFM